MIRFWNQYGVLLIGLVCMVFAMQSVALWFPYEWTAHFAANATVWPLLQLGLACCVILCAGALWISGRKRIAVVYAVAGLLSCVSSVQLILSLSHFAKQHTVSISLSEQSNMFRKKVLPDELNVKYAEVNRTPLHLSSYFTHIQAGSQPVILYVHGGSWSGGSRTENGQFFRWLNSLGYDVFSIDYRTSRDMYPSWQDAPRDVVCALSWISSVSEQYDLDTNKITVMGDSAGGQLALRAAYGVKNGDLQSSCGGRPVVPASVVGIVPAIDFRELYSDPRRSTESQASVVQYLGGTPHEYPARYDDASIINHVHPGLMPTLIINAQHDTLVNPRSGKALADALHNVGVPVEQHTLPYAVHSYWINPGGYQSQTARTFIARFLK